MTPSDAVVPWPALISGVVGIAGVAGTLAGIFLTNRVGELRVQMQQDHDDRCRFHNERVELYGRLLAASQTCRDAAASLSLHVDETEGDVEEGAMRPLQDAIGRVVIAGKMAELVASERVLLASIALTNAAVVLAVPASWQGDQGIEKYCLELADAESDFSDAARSELLPAEMLQHTSG